jgi:hypothetical protein
MSPKTNRKNGKAKPEKETPKYSYEFLAMLSDTAFITLIAHLRKAKAPEDVIRLLDRAWVLMVEQENLAIGGEQTNDSLSEYVAEAVQCIAALGGEWRSSSGTITPLAEVLQRAQAIKSNKS